MPGSSWAWAGSNSVHTYFPFLASPEEMGENDSISSVHTPHDPHGLPVQAIIHQVTRSKDHLFSLGKTAVNQKTEHVVN